MRNDARHSARPSPGQLIAATESDDRSAADEDGPVAGMQEAHARPSVLCHGRCCKQDQGLRYTEMWFLLSGPNGSRCQVA
jgi:hypothetical protein